MSKYRLAITTAFVLTVIALTALTPAAAAINTGDKAPDFSLGSVNGDNTVKLSTLYDKQPTVLVFWASWCPHCQKEIPVLQGIYKDLQPKGLHIVGVSLDGKIGDARDYLKDHPVTFPMAFGGTDKGYDVAQTYGIKGVPSVFIIGKGGVVKAKYAGEVSGKTLRDQLDKLGVK